MIEVVESLLAAHLSAKVEFQIVTDLVRGNVKGIVVHCTLLRVRKGI